MHARVSRAGERARNWKMRSIWSGAIAFGLVSVPVRMESAVEEHKLHFNDVHEPDGGRIGYQKVCKAEDEKPVPEDEIVKAFEVKKGKWVNLDYEDFAELGWASSSPA